jgi:hypothetical protein
MLIHTANFDILFHTGPPVICITKGIAISKISNFAAVNKSQ